MPMAVSIGAILLIAQTLQEPVRGSARVVEETAIAWRIRHRRNAPPLKELSEGRGLRALLNIAISAGPAAPSRGHASIRLPAHALESKEDSRASACNALRAFVLPELAVSLRVVRSAAPRAALVTRATIRAMAPPVAWIPASFRADVAAPAPARSKRRTNALTGTISETERIATAHRAHLALAAAWTAHAKKMRSKEAAWGRANPLPQQLPAAA